MPKQNLNLHLNLNHNLIFRPEARACLFARQTGQKIRRALTLRKQNCQQGLSAVLQADRLNLNLNLNLNLSRTTSNHAEQSRSTISTSTLSDWLNKSS